MKTTTKPVKPIDLPPRDVRRILEWAKTAGAERINRMEQELAAHLMLPLDDSIAHEWASKSTMKSRQERIDELRGDIAANRQTFFALIELRDQIRAADIERDAVAIAGQVLQNRRAEAAAAKNAEDKSKTVSEQ